MSLYAQLTYDLWQAEHPGRVLDVTAAQYRAQA